MAEWSEKTTVEDVSERIKSLSVSEECLEKGRRASKRTSNIPRLKQQRLSASDSLCETTRPSSSSSSQSSSRLRIVKENLRRKSESAPGFLLPHSLRAQHAAHRCAWSESDKCSPSSSAQFKRTTVSNNCSSSSSSSRMDTPSSRAKDSDRRKGNGVGKQKFDFYMPLCEVQQHLKRGELIEGILRINPRNYEDSYISAPDGQMDIYIGGTHDRNRALNGDCVAVQLNPPHLWKVIADDIEEVKNADKLLDQQCNSVSPAADTVDSGWGYWADRGAQHGCDTVEILGVENILRQAGLYKDGKNHSSLAIPDGTSWTVTPDELLNLSELNVGEDDEGRSEDNDFNQIASTAVAPDQLSGEDYSPCHSDDSVGSCELAKTLEDSQFLATQQNAANNNVPVVPMPEAQPVVPMPEAQLEDIGWWQSGDAAAQQTEPIPSKSPSPSSGVENSAKKKKKRKRKKKKKASTQNAENPPQKVSVEERVEEATNHLKKRNFKTLGLSVEEVMKYSKWEKFVQKTGKVVCIVEKKHPRVAVGHIKVMQDRNRGWALFSPTDHKLPRLCVPMANCPEGFYERPSDYSKVLFVSKILNWDENATFAEGVLFRTLGEAGDIETETAAILLENDVDDSDFIEQLVEELPTKSSSWAIPQAEIESRLDLRKSCIFTIDPKTARDLDDALSCSSTDDGFLEIGVHIADVTFFLTEGSALDKLASERATSVYLVQKVVPMLPRLLCEKLCSLHPGEDKLAFSVIWKITREGVILEETIRRSIIHSCTKLSYDHAQDIIDNPNKPWLPEEMPPFHNGFGIDDISASIRLLHEVAVKLRARRFRSGALRLDQVKINFALDMESGLPSGYSLYNYKESNKLVEEFMLLANMAVAHKIYQAWPEKAFLRCHSPPMAKMMEDVVEMCATLGIHLDATTAGSLQESISQYFGEDLTSIARSSILTHLCTKPMKPARYFCAGCTTSPTQFHHYALNVPLYTHFTSPIRRYPDVIVHRMLAASLGLGPKPTSSQEKLQRLAEHCNNKKYTAKRIHEMSCEMFLAAFVQISGPLEEKAVVMATMDHSFDVLIMSMGAVKRIYTDKLNLKKVVFTKQQGIPQLTLTWSSLHVQVITIFTVIDVILSAVADEPLRFNAILKPPNSI